MESALGTWQPLLAVLFRRAESASHKPEGNRSASLVETML